MSNIRSLTTRLTTALASRGGKFDHHFLSLKFTVGPQLSFAVIAAPVRPSLVSHCSWGGEEMILEGSLEKDKIWRNSAEKAG